ncbi:MAG: class I SAM-dependent methyltransferase [Bacteroidales bacterium]|nr:class I SAM-dependent methyltransferase [Bacteroidales bacterium]
MQKRHTDRQKYFNEQELTTSRYVVPFIAGIKKIEPDCSVLEIGCGEGGNMKPFLDMGCKVTGVDLSESKINNARLFFSNHPNRDRLTLLSSDIFDVSSDLGRFDILMMRDVLEHIHDQGRFLHFIKGLMKEDSVLFAGFPPWQNPFGGHQQICRNRFLSKTPYLHLLPGVLYKRILRWGGEPVNRIENLMEVRETRISIERFLRIVRKEQFRIAGMIHYLINPNYEIKFGLSPLKVHGWLTALPWLRNFYTTTCYYLIMPR